MTTEKAKWRSPFNLKAGDRIEDMDGNPVKILRVHRDRVSVWFELEDLQHTKTFVLGDEVRVIGF